MLLVERKVGAGRKHHLNGIAGDQKYSDCTSTKSPLNTPVVHT